MRGPQKKVRPKWSHWTFGLDVGAPAPDKVIRRFDKPQVEFDIALLEDVLAIDPDHLDTMQLLAELYTRNGQFRAGLRMDRRIVAASPRDAVANYNLACSLALTRHLDECFKVLRQAIRLGYRDIDHMATDTDLEAAHEDPRWLELFDLTKA